MKSTKSVLLISLNRFRQKYGPRSMNRRQLTYLYGPKKQVDFGICFDIDGVIARGYVPFPEAREAYRMLVERSGKPLVPTCFVTNALSTNKYKADQLTEWLGNKVHPDQMIMSQGPLSLYADYHDKFCLLLGQGPLQEIAADLGFTNVCLMDDILEAYPLLDVANHEKRIKVATSDICEEELPNIEVILLLGEPKNWESQLQVLIDVLLTNGKPSYKCTRLNYQTVPVIGCNVDFQYMHRAKFPRFGHGAFLLCLEALFQKLTGKMLEYSVLVGKPSEITFRYTEHCLSKSALKIGIRQSIQKMYMIGDNVEVDIAGANLYQKYIRRPFKGAEVNLPSSRTLPQNVGIRPQTVRDVYGILVKTGVSAPDPYAVHSHRDFILDQDLLQPHIIVDDVKAAVEYILERESKEK